MAGEGNTPFSATTTAATATSSEAVRGVGGKIKREFTRSQSTTPYSRPPQNARQRRPWLSRIVDPAYRIISDGVSKIRPYVFSTADTVTAPNDQDQNQDMMQVDPQASEEKGTSSTQNMNEANVNISAEPRGTTDLNDSDAISEVKNLMEGKAYSQDEIDRLVEVVTSRASDVKKDEGTSSREGATENVSFFGGKDAKSKFCATPIPFPKSKSSDEAAKETRDEDDLSPVELAKAYMKGQISASSSRGSESSNEKDRFDKLFATSPKCKPSASWPGINLNEKCSFKTPQSKRGSDGLHNHPRTPYYRTPLPNSKEKLMQLKDNYSKHLKNLQSPSQSAQTRYRPLNLSKERESGLFRPIERPRQSASPSPYSRPSSGTSPLVNSSIMETSEVREIKELKNLSKSQTTTTSSEPKVFNFGYPSVHPHSTRIATRILETLERIHPTPKEKSADLNLDSFRRYQQSPKNLEHNRLNFNSEKNPSNEVIENVLSTSSVPKPSEVTTGHTQNSSHPKPPGNNEPVLPSISVTNPLQKWTAPSSSNTSFTFPVSSSDRTTTSEPTTPSFMPFRTSTAPSHPEVPQFGFKSNKGGDKSPLVFTFPSVSEEKSNEDDDRLDIKFGSDKRQRVSFGSAGIDSACC